MPEIKAGDVIVLPGFFRDEPGSGFPGSTVDVKSVENGMVTGVRIAGGQSESIMFPTKDYPGLIVK